MISKDLQVQIGCCLALIVVMLMSSGCGESVPPKQVFAAEAAVEAGFDAHGREEFMEAEKQFTIALSGGLTRPDLVEQALLGRARSRIALGMLDEAVADLNELSEGAADLDQVWVVRAELAQKVGDAEAAKLAYLEAKKINRRLTIPAEMR